MGLNCMEVNRKASQRWKDVLCVCMFMYGHNEDRIKHEGNGNIDDRMENKRNDIG